MRNVEIVRREEDFEGLLPRGLPHNAEAERAILGSVLLDNSLVFSAMDAGIVTEAFYVYAHKYIWTAYEVLAQHGKEIDPITLSEELSKQGRSEQVGMTFISELTYGLPHFTNIRAYAKILLDHMGMRALVKICNLATSMAIEGEDDASTVWANVEALILEGASAYSPMRGHKKARERGFVHVVQDKPALREALQNAYEGKSSGLPTGIPRLDRMLKGGGLQPQGFYIKAARPKAGKTSLVLKIADNVARTFAAQNVRRSVGIVSMEMARLALIERRFSAFTKIPLLDMSQAGFRGPQFERALASLDAFFDMPLYITDAIYNIPDMWRAGERLVFGETQAALIVVDYIQLAEFRKAQDAPVKDRYQVVSMVSRELKHMAQEWNVPVIGVSSINRLAPTENREPELHDLRESGQLEFDADAISFLVNAAWKPKMTEEEKLALEQASVWDINYILKAQRSGPSGTIPLKFLKKYTDYMTPEEFEAYMRGRRPAEPDFREESKIVRPDEIPF